MKRMLEDRVNSVLVSNEHDQDGRTRRLVLDTEALHHIEVVTGDGGLFRLVVNDTRSRVDVTLWPWAMEALREFLSEPDR